MVSWFLHRWEITFPIPREPQLVGWLAGASMLIRREVFDSIGLFDEGFFLYYEETDFCLRAHRAGWPTWYIPHSRVAHIGGSSTGFKDITRPRATYWFESRRRYFQKNHGTLYLWITNSVCRIQTLRACCGILSVTIFCRGKARRPNER